MSSFSLEDLARTIAERAGSGDPQSYTAKLVARGVSQCAKKFGEEAFELALASVEGDRRHVTAEAADVLYHLLVLLHAAGIGLDDVKAELAARTGQTGLQEKAAREAQA
jgi:phosphoribosyl-ATP pyrophosphohydrolase